MSSRFFLVKLNPGLRPNDEIPAEHLDLFEMVVHSSQFLRYVTIYETPEYIHDISLGLSSSCLCRYQHDA